MKKLFCCVMLTFMLLMGFHTPSAWAAYESFENGTIGSASPNWTQPQGQFYTIQGNGYGATSKSLGVALSTTARSAYFSYPTQTLLRASFLLKTPAVSIRGLTVSLGNGSATSNGNATINFYADRGKFYASDAATMPQLVAYETDREYRITIVADCATQKYSLLIEDFTGTIYSNSSLNFKSSTTSFQRFVLTSLTQSAGVGVVACADEISLDDNSGSIATPAPLPPSTQAVAVQRPQAYEIFQRQNNLADIPINGTLQVAATSLEAKWNGNPEAVWFPLALNGNSFSGLLANQPTGQGDVQIRLNNAQIFTIACVSIGDRYLFIGQSNMAGRGATLNVASDSLYKAVCLDAFYHWKVCSDPTGIDNQSAGSYAALFATLQMQKSHVPVGIINAAMGGTSVNQWQPGGALLNDALLRASGGVVAVVWHQGESDAGNMNSATYTVNLSNVVGVVKTSTGAPFYAVQLQKCSALTQAGQDEINAGIASLKDNGTINGIVDLRSISADGDGLHITDNAKLLQVAARVAWVLNQ